MSQTQTSEIKLCSSDKCTGCAACKNICPRSAISISYDVAYCRPLIDASRCIGCRKCINVCHQLSPLEKHIPIIWYQGWTKDRVLRLTSSSGGFASAIARSFIKQGGAVCSCVFSGGEFLFDIANNSEEASRFVGSKYVKSHLDSAYLLVRDELKAGRRVLFIGLPCQVAAIRKYVALNRLEGLETIDLICHGTPSQALLRLFLEEQVVDVNNIKNISFRKKAKAQLKYRQQYVGEPGVTDRYLIGFLNGLTFTENCYQCHYAQIGRVSDLTLGDSWGTNLSEQMIDGVSLALCQTKTGMNLLKSAELELLPVDIDNAIKNNGQLEHPMNMPAKRAAFFSRIEGGALFDTSVARCLPKQCLRQDIKLLLTKLGIYHRGVGYQVTYLLTDSCPPSNVECGNNREEAC